jgi:hypothetical protein
MTAEAATMRDAVAHVRDAHGSLERYALAHGLRRDQIDALRRSLLDTDPPPPVGPPGAPNERQHGP